MRSEYKSRIGKLSCSPGEAFYFVTDIRNLQRFIPKGTISNLKVDKDSCSFDVSMLGSVNINIADKKAPEKVTYTGQAANVNDFSLVLDISGTEDNKANAKVTLLTDLNPFMKSMAEKPIAQVLEGLIAAMEKFNNWQDVRG
jgi:hypothetical protein